MTTHRVLWVDAGAAPSTGASCALPLAALGRAELRATRLWSSQKVRLHVRADRAGVPTAAPDGATREVKVIAPGQAALLAAVQASLVARAWERAGGGEPSPTASPPVDDGLLAAVVAMGYGVQRAARALRATGGTDAQEAVLWLMEREGDASLDEPLDEGPGPGAALGAPRSSAALNAASAGVAGILNREAQAAASTDRAVEEAFRDLRALMASAADMVQLAQRYREAQAGGDVSFEDELAAIGIASPVTRDSAGALYIAELSKQVGSGVGGLKWGRGCGVGQRRALRWAAVAPPPSSSTPISTTSSSTMPAAGRLFGPARGGSRRHAAPDGRVLPVQPCARRGAGVASRRAGRRPRV